MARQQGCRSSNDHEMSHFRGAPDWAQFRWPWPTAFVRSLTAARTRRVDRRLSGGASSVPGCVQWKSPLDRCLSSARGIRRFTGG